MTRQEIEAKDKSLIWNSFTPIINQFGHIRVKTAKGVISTTIEDKKIMDPVSLWWVNINGLLPC